MTSYRESRVGLGAIALSLALPPAPATVAGVDDAAIHTEGLSSLSRLVRHFDFEEGERAPFEMPLNFYRYGAVEGGIGHGFPPFGTMRLTRESSYSGNWSLMFELDGGSMAARVPSAVIPVMPGTDYAVAARVKTEGLNHARVRLVGWLYDEHGRIIPGSRNESPLARTDSEWQVIAVSVRGRYEQATDLGLELQLLQPRQFERGASDPFTPTLSDVSGRAYFDDVSVWQQPRILVRTDQPGNVIVSPEEPRLQIEVHDIVHQALDARLQVFDVNGEMVFEDRFPAPRSPRQLAIDLPLDRFGWYRVVLDILLEGELAAQRWTDLAYLPPPHRTGVGQHHRFTLTLPETWQEYDDVLPELVGRLGAGVIILPVLSESMTRQTAREWYQRSRRTIERLRSGHIELTFSLDSIPKELAQELDLDPEEVLLALEREATIWRDYLDDLIVNYSFEVSRWQIGRTSSEAVAWLDDAPRRIDRMVSGLRRLVPGGSVLIPTIAQHTLEALADYAVHHVSIPHHARPENVEAYIDLWLGGDNPQEPRQLDPGLEGLLVNIQSTPIGMYSHRQRAIDLTLRVLHAWRASAINLSMKPPWSTRSFNGTEIIPEETLPVWSQLIDQLRGRRVIGKLSIGQGLHCWLLEGVDRADAALAVWKEPGARSGGNIAGAAEAHFVLQLADGPVVVTDGFGNRRIVPLRNDMHVIELEQMPQFIEGINLELVQFRGGFSIEPDFLPVEARVHEHELILRNPWSMPINGTIRLREMEGMTFSPRTHRFSIPADGTLRVPVEIQITRSIVAGTRRIQADVSLTADGQYDLLLFKDVTMGLQYIDFAATSRSSPNPETGEDDLIITQYITNTGNEPLNVEAFMLGRGVPHERRLIAGLNPGEIAIRVFTIPDGANRLAGERIRIGVIERDGVGRLNQVIEIPQRQTMP